MRSIHTAPRKTVDLLTLAERQARAADLEAIQRHETAARNRTVDLARHGSLSPAASEGETSWTPPAHPRDRLAGAQAPQIIAEHTDPARPWCKVTVYGQPSVTRDRDLASEHTGPKPIGVGNRAANKYAADVLLALLSVDEFVPLNQADGTATVEAVSHSANRALDTGLYLADQAYRGGVLLRDGKPETPLQRAQRKDAKRKHAAAMAACESAADARRAAYAAAMYGQHLPIKRT